MLALLVVTAAVARAETPTEIVAKAAQQMQKANRLRDDYVYREKQIDRELGGDGKVKKTQETEKEIMVFAGEQVARVTEKDGKPLPEKEARKEQQKVDRAAAQAAHLTPEETQARLEKRDREFAKSNSWLTDLPSAFHFTLQGEEALNGGQVYRIHAVPDASYKGRDSNLFRCVEGDLYIEKQTYTLVKMQGEFLEDCSFGFFLAKVDKGSKIDFERVLVNNEVWLPKEIKISGEGRALLKKFNAETDISYSGYRKFSTESHIVAVGAPQ